MDREKRKPDNDDPKSTMENAGADGPNIGRGPKTEWPSGESWRRPTSL